MMCLNLKMTGKWVLIWECSVRAIQWIPIWQGLDDFQKSLCPCALEKSSLSLWRVKWTPLLLNKEGWPVAIGHLLWPRTITSIINLSDVLSSHEDECFSTGRSPQRRGQGVYINLYGVDCGVYLTHSGSGFNPFMPGGFLEICQLDLLYFLR